MRSIISARTATIFLLLSVLSFLFDVSLPSEVSLLSFLAADFFAGLLAGGLFVGCFFFEPVANFLAGEEAWEPHDSDVELPEEVVHPTSAAKPPWGDGGLVQEARDFDVRAGQALSENQDS